jgi:hypothetical protein
MITVKCTYTNGDTITTSINANMEEARTYFLGKWFNIGSVNDNMQQCVKVEEVK